MHGAQTGAPTGLNPHPLPFYCEDGGGGGGATIKQIYEYTFLKIKIIILNLIAFVSSYVEGVLFIRR